MAWLFQLRLDKDRCGVTHLPFGSYLRLLLATGWSQLILSHANKVQRDALTEITLKMLMLKGHSVRHLSRE